MMSNQTVVLWIVLSLGVGVSWSGELPTRFHVAPDGRDSNSGSLAEPFATVERARDAVREAKRLRPNHSYAVLIHGGRYRLSRTVVFDLRDSAADGHSITYAAYEDEQPVFTSTVPIMNWRRLDELPAGASEKARAHLWVTEVPSGLGRFYTLYDDEGLLPRARSHGVKPTQPFPLAWPKGGDFYEACRTLHYPPGFIRDWANLEDMEIVIIPAHRWMMNILQLGSVDEANAVARTTLPGTYPLCATINFDESLWVENAIDYLDEPGEWVLSTREGRLYLWPRHDGEPKGVCAPRLGELFCVEGRIDERGPEDVPVKGLILRGLSFTGADRVPWTGTDKGMQHDWAMEDKPNALLRLRGAEQCAVENCLFADSGQHAIRVDYHGQRIRIANNEIHNLGGAGIIFFGYGPGTKDVSHHNEIVNNHIHHIGQIRWDSHGIILWQSGHNRVAHNYIHDVPRKAICVSGARLYSYRPDRRGLREYASTIRWHEVLRPPETWADAMPYTHSRHNLIADNEVARALLRLADGAAINISGAGPGNIIRHNLVREIHNHEVSGMMRTDDFQDGTLFEHNILLDSDVGGITLKGNNIIRNNIMIAVGHRKADFIHTAPQWGPFDKAAITHNVFYHLGGDQHFYYHLDPNHTGPFKESTIDRNVYYNAEADSTADNPLLRQLRADGHDQHSRYADPGFIDWRNGDFRFQGNSSAKEIGIEPVTTEGIGLTQDFPERFKRYLPGEMRRGQVKQ